MRRYFFAVLVCATAASGTPIAQSPRLITEKDLFKFTWIADPQISTDGSTVALVRVTVNERENRYETSIFTVPTSGSEPPRRLTSGIRDTTPRWSPDGKRLVFVRTAESRPATGAGEDNTKGQPQLYLLEMDGGEARAITDLSGGAGNPAWAPDGRLIAFTAATTREGREGQERHEGQEGSNHKSDVRVITRAVYRENGNPGFVGTDRRSHIFVVRAPEGANDKPTPTQITDGEFDENGIVWAPDGSKVYFTSTRVAEPYYEEAGSELFSVPIGGGSITKVASIDGSINGVSPSPDGKRLAFVGTLRGRPIRSYSQSDLWISDAAPGSPPRNLTANYDFDIAGGIGGDQAAPRGQNRKPIVWSKDGSSLLVVSAKQGSANLERITIANGKVESVTEGAQDVMAYSATPDASTIAATVSTQTNIADLFVVRSGSERTASRSGSARLAVPPQITHVNQDLFQDIRQSEPEEIWYTASTAGIFRAGFLKPPDFDASRKYPLVLEIHGGPHAAYGNTYTHEFQWMAAMGYVVLYTNPRGSTSYGQEFGNIIQYRYPGDDYKDLMAGVDEVLKKGYVDPNRLGVTGGSGGGLLTNWTITQTQRFKAAVAQRDIADWYGFWFTADFTLFQPTWFRKAPWEDPQDFAARSPITHVANVTTPLMLVLGDQDFRTPPADGGEMMFRALKFRRIPTVMVRFPRENHELSRSGEPWHRVERLEHIVGWMDQWLQGKKSSAYTTQ